ncbi:cystinosin homolog isoform X2 [Eurosta solidaginis]
MGGCNGNGIRKCTKILILSILAIGDLTTQTVTAMRNDLNGKDTSLSVSTYDLTVLVQGNTSFEVLVRRPLERDVNVSLVRQHEALVELRPNDFTITAGNPQNQTITIFGIQPGHLEITAKSVSNETWIVDDLFVRVTVAKSEALIVISVVVGWMYFSAWSSSFYPQIHRNIKKRSVVGLNFDFLALNLLGFLMYGIFNCGLYWIPGIQSEYFSRHPRGLIPVLLNDVVFSLHASCATIFIIGQCFVYDRGDQRLSNIASTILIVVGIILLTIGIMAVMNVIQWLDFLYYCSYLKLVVTVIKYVPQAVMNYRLKSTKGWSVYNVLMDLTGSILSMLQMILNAYNYDDWVSIFGDPTKFGLGLISVPFDVLFILQHFVFYRKKIFNSTLTDITEVAINENGKQRY